MSNRADEEKDRMTVRAETNTVPMTPAMARTQASDSANGLPLGTRLGEFEIKSRLGEGGFSIVYLAWDHSLDRRVALKEYMPSSIAMRHGGTQVTARSERHREAFDAGLKSFVNEGKLLAQFDHAALVKVYRFWELNGTAYMVMPVYEGVTLKEAVRSMSVPPSEEWLLALLAPLTDALSVIHAEQCYHRDIAPDNVMLLAGSQKPLLLDFGAARRVIGDMTQALTVILKPGYAPIEQYAEVPGMKQGPWTDVYALGAVVYWAITGKTPLASVGRILRDAHEPLVTVAAGRYSPMFLAAVDRALVLLPEQRTQSIQDFRRDLGLDTDAYDPERASRIADPDATVIRPARHVPAISTARHAAAAQSATRPTNTASSAPRLSKLLPYATATFGAVLIAGAAWWILRTPAPSAPSTAAPLSNNAPTISRAAVPTGIPSDVTDMPPASQEPMASPASATVSRVPITSTESPNSQGLGTVTGSVAQPMASSSASGGATKSLLPPSRYLARAPRGEAVKPERKASAQSTECDRILVRQSMGEDSAQLHERYRALDCR